MNKYFIKIPYSFPQYGELSGFVFAESENEAAEIAEDRINIHDESYDDEDSGDSTYDYDEMRIELEDSDIPNNEIPSSQTQNSGEFSESTKIPNHFLEELPMFTEV